ncbi:hypothetical protein D3C72_2294430 [compost metagenome]
MAQQDGLAVMLDDFPYRGDQPLDAGGIGDLAVGDRHVEVGPEQHALVLEVELVESLEGRGHRWSPGYWPLPWRSRAARTGEAD